MGEKVPPSFFFFEGVRRGKFLATERTLLSFCFCPFTRCGAILLRPTLCRMPLFLCWQTVTSFSPLSFCARLVLRSEASRFSPFPSKEIDLFSQFPYAALFPLMNAAPFPSIVRVAAPLFFSQSNRKATPARWSTPFSFFHFSFFLLFGLHRHP